MAFEFYRQSAQSHPEARFKLAEMYEKGEGTNKDKVYAHMWYYAAGRLWSPRHYADEITKEGTSRRNINLKMTEEEETKAARLYRDCVAKVFTDC